MAQIELDAYRQGEMLQNDRLFRSQITMAQVDLTRQADRLKWNRRMIVKGYASAAQVVADELAMRRLVLTLAQAEMAFRNYQRFTAPKELLAMKSQVIGTAASLAFQSIRLKREEERLALYQSMVDRCTIRAPHDGFVIYANRPGRAPEVELGATIRQRQRLFSLPDLSKMEVQALLHETVVNRVRVGMPVRVRLEALPDLKLKGSVKSIAPLPYAERKSETGRTDVTYFQAQVQLTTTPEGLRPGMTAELVIATGRREGVLAVPNAAVTDEGGRHVCHVAHPDRLEVRPVTLGEASHDWQEITQGLGEGEEVALDTAPARSDSLLSRATGWMWN